MIKEKVLTERVRCCDCCEETLYDPTAVRNDGSYQSHYIKIGNIDLCYVCGARVLENLKAPEEKAKVWVENLKEIMKNDKGLFRSTLSKLSIDPLSFSINCTETTGVGETLRTTGVNEMKFQTTCNSLADIDKAPSLASLDLVTLSVPAKGVSKLTNLGEL